MKYKVTVELLVDNEKKDARYPDFASVYMQYVNDLDISGLVNWINRPSAGDAMEQRADKPV
jgi:hypothetical protein